MTRFFQNIDLMKVLQKRRLHLAAAVLMAGILSVVFSGERFITPKYKSTAFVYPVNIIPYSMETPTEQLLQLFTSSDVRNMMVRRFRLPDHYEIDTASSTGRTRMYIMYDENVTVKKTEYESVRIDILDQDPDKASEMVSELIHFVDVKARSVQREKTAEVVQIYSEQMRLKKVALDSVKEQLDELRIRYGLLDYKVQSKEVLKSYLKLASDNASISNYRGVDSMYRHLEYRGGELLSLSSQEKALQEDYNTIRSNYDQAVSDMAKELTYTNIMANPYPADSKSYPVRWIIVVVSILSTFLLALISFIIIDRKKEE